ncbi:hypothetical protein [Pseudomonas sp. NPDC089734]|uniref:hypothetical protein n=1 Tax=Pseudomonas sp. NPDC089734 TaxID=3364469 RepID=UPI0038218BBF
MQSAPMHVYLLPVLLIIGVLLSVALPSTNDLTSPKFLMCYSTCLMTLAGGCWLSFKSQIPFPLWLVAMMLVIAAVGLPFIKLHFSQ